MSKTNLLISNHTQFPIGAMPCDKRILVIHDGTSMLEEEEEEEEEAISQTSFYKVSYFQ